MITVDAALDIIRAHPYAASSGVVTCEEALGRVLAQDVVSPFGFPLFDNSAMDGFAVGSPEGPWEVIGEVAAGDSRPSPLSPCQAVRIFTGAPTPGRTYGVIAQEDAKEEMGMLLGEVRRGGHIRLEGEEATAGHLLAAKGARLTPAHVAAFASCGVDKVEVLAQPRVAVLSTGNEVVSPGVPLRFGQVYNSNAPALTTTLKLWGIQAQASHAKDSEVELRESIDRGAAESDLLITTGGVSAGAHDLVRPAMEAAGFQVRFHGVAVKPGKPVAFAVRNDGKAWFGLPGNPLSTWVGLLVFVGAWLGHELRRESRILAESFERKPGREEFIPAALSSSGEVTIKRVVGSHANFGLLESDGFVRMDHSESTAVRGESVEYLPFPWSDGL